MLGHNHFPAVPDMIQMGNQYIIPAFLQNMPPELVQQYANNAMSINFILGQRGNLNHQLQPDSVDPDQETRGKFCNKFQSFIIPQMMTLLDESLFERRVIQKLVGDYWCSRRAPTLL